ncbi:MAG: thymidylate kinase [Bacillota bacterium]|nr:MAG: thymidylate kinase [Bacillota bacterium]MBS3950967.1 dTMP kinase [Peptococcaceae bacterium]
MTKGMFISFEGPDASGKTTQVRGITAALTARGLSFVVTREPGGTELGECVRDMLLSHRYPIMSKRTEMLLYAASRAQHVDEIIRPNLAEGKYVICDRFIDSSLIYQGLGLDLGIEDVFKVNMVATDGLLPDLTIVLGLSAEQSLERLAGKGELDRIESRSLSYHQKVSEGYRRLYELFPNRVVSFDGRLPAEVITRAIIEKIDSFKPN